MVYVDDVLITGTVEVDIIQVKKFLDSVFTIKDLGYAKYGLEIACGPEGMYIHQRKYVLDIICDAGMLQAKPTSIPMPKGQKFSSNSPLPPKPNRYRRLIGRLLYLTMTHPDIAFVIQQLSQHVATPQLTHWDAALYLLCYLRHSSTTGLFLPSHNNLHLAVD